LKGRGFQPRRGDNIRNKAASAAEGTMAIEDSGLRALKYLSPSEAPGLPKQHLLRD
jgi:hypothetical protein